MKKIIGFIRLEIESGKASPSPPVGPALGLRGVNIMQFCKDFNGMCRTLEIREGVPLPTIITIYEDKSFAFKIAAPSVTYFLKNCIGVKKGASKPGKDSIGIVDPRLVYELATIKNDKKTQPLEIVCKSITGSLKSMGLQLSK